jgi:hypothetical protein
MKQSGRRWWIVAAAVTWMLVFGVSVARADGYVISEPVPSSSIMADQRAIIVYRDGHEDLVISIGLDLRSEQELPDMAWIIPVPSPPEVQVTSAALFDELDRLSAPEVVYRTERRGGFRWGLGAEAPPPEVQVLERKQVGVYDVAVIAGREGGALLDWLHAEGFTLPDALQPALDAYIAEDWIFTAMRIAPDADRNEIFSAQPVWLSFDAERMVYPMRLTGVRDSPLALRLYVLADHRYELAGFTTEFAGDVQVDAPDPAMASLLNRSFYFTRLFDQAVTPAEMAVDFYPHQAPSDEPYQEQVVQTYVSYGWGIGAGELAFLCGGCWLALAVLLAVLLVAIRFSRRRKGRPAS